ncbi:MAG: hypothetical protein JWR12_2084 [Mucilaginibacter sp.]|nr:hypothetical protein [Mucilaginibacter sp.]
MIYSPYTKYFKKDYQNTYPITTINTKAITRNLITSGSTANNSQFDFSQHIMPDWKNALTYTRFNNKVIDIPIDPSDKIGTALKNNDTGQEIYQKENSKSSFLLINDGLNYHAYIMTVIADPAYLNNDKIKLAGNTYNKRDKKFSGMLLYFTPKGQFIKSYSYKNGQLIPSAAKSPIALVQRGQTVTTSKIRTRDVQVCTDWYIDTYVDDVLVSSEYIGTTCDSGGGTSGVGSPSSSDPGFIDDGGFPSPTDPTSIFGINGSNAQIQDGNFDNYLNYLISIGASFSDPTNTTVTYNGVEYTGQFTFVYDASGSLVATYFSPDVSGGPFQVGMEYNLGNEDPGTIVNTSSLLDLGYGSPAGYLGSGSTIGYTVGGAVPLQPQILIQVMSQTSQQTIILLIMARRRTFPNK